MGTHTRAGDTVISMSDIGTQLTITAVDGGFELAGEIDAHTAPPLQERLTEHLGTTPDIRIDMRSVTFMDSSGLRVLLATTETSRAGGGDLTIFSPSPTVTRLLDISGLNEHFSIAHDS